MGADVSMCVCVCVSTYTHLNILLDSYVYLFYQSALVSIDQVEEIHVKGYTQDFV